MVEIVTFDPGCHLDPWRKFIRESYSNPAYVLLSENFRRWQFCDNPANETGAYTLWLVLHRDAVIAQLGFVPFIAQEPHGETFSGAWPVNLNVDPAYRALGLGAILMDRLLKQAHVVNPGSSEAGATLCTGLGMVDLGHLHRWIAIVDPVRATPLAADGKLPSGVEQATAERATQIGGGIAPVRRLPASAPDCFRPPFSARHARRDRGFMRWRYEEHPGFDYEFLLDESGGNILVFHEEREAKSGASLLRVVDLMADAAAAPRLLAAAVLAAHARGAALVDFYCSLTHYAPALEQAGFFNERDHPDGRIAALFQPLDFRKVGIRVLVSESQSTAPWYITKADSDQDRPNDAALVEQRAVAR